MLHEDVSAHPVQPGPPASASSPAPPASSQSALAETRVLACTDTKVMTCAPLSTAAAPEKPPDTIGTIVPAVAPVVASAMWPLVAIVAFLYLKKHLIQLLTVLTTRAEDKSTNVTIGALSFVKAQSGEIETLRASLSQLQAIVNAAPSVATAPRPAQDVLKELEPLAQDYDAATAQAIPDYSTRVRKKDELGRRMGALVYRNKVALDTLLNRGDAYLTALANATLLDSSSGDVGLLCEAASQAQRYHPRYAIAMALGGLISANRVSQAQAPLVASALDFMLREADPSLRERIAKTRALLAQKGRADAAP